MCESDARLISRVMPQPHEIDPHLLDKRMDLLHDLRNLSTGIDAVLEETVLLGVAFHRMSYSWLHTSRRTHTDSSPRREYQIILCLPLLADNTQAGLTVEERDLIANAYDTGVILVCVATCSLAAGINLY